MWHPSPVKLGKVLVAVVFFSVSTSANACLFPCLWGWGWGGYYPPPMYAAPAYGYGAPMYAPSPCGAGGCSPCGPGGCSSFYSPQACCAPCGTGCSPCGTGCSPCGTGCSPCGAGGCATGNCGVNYNGDMTPQADRGPTNAQDKQTYDPADKNKTSTSGMPEDDFGAVNRGTGGAPGKGGDPFVQPTTPAGTPAGTGTEEKPPAPMDEKSIPNAKPVQFSPSRSRTIARAQYRVPRIARLHVVPETRWLPASEGRIVQR